MKEFLLELSKYYRKENDLSNVAVALCNSDMFFREKFIHYFFPRLNNDSISQIIREVPDETSNDSRVDIHLTLNDCTLPYIIEVKINDRNHHFGQYEKAYGIGRERFGYITNYYCEEGIALGYDVKQWEELYKYLQEFAKQSLAIEAFSAYLEKVCEIKIYTEPMRLQNLASIPQFIETVEKIALKGQMPAKVYSQGQKIYAYKSSIHRAFYFQYEEVPEINVFILEGLWYQDTPIISICINSRKDISRAVLEKQPFKGCNYCAEAYRENFWDANDVWVEMLPQKREEFQNATTVDEQESILSGFLKEFIERLKSIVIAEATK